MAPSSPGDEAEGHSSGLSKDGSEDIFFTVRNIQCEYYMAPLEVLAKRHGDMYRPLMEDLQADPRFRYRLPVVRIFGSTPMGQRACLHLHGALPYLFVKPQATVEGPSRAWKDRKTVEDLVPQLEVELEKAIHMAKEEEYQQQQKQQQQGQPNGPRMPAPAARPPSKPWKIVYRAEVVRGKALYGYHGHEEYFIKVWLLDPRSMARVVSVLQSGVILGTTLQPHDAHFPFLLQLFGDLSLVGMGYVHLSNFHHNVRFRPPLPLTAEYQHEVVEEGQARPSQDPREVDVRFRLWLRGNVDPAFIEGGEGEGGEGRGEHGRAEKEEEKRRGGGDREGHGKGRDHRPGEKQAGEGQDEGLVDREAAVAEVLENLSWSQDLLWSQAPDRGPSGGGRGPSAQEGRGAQGPPSTSAAPEEEEGEERGDEDWSARMSTCELELDAHVEDVLNPRFGAREAASTGNLLNSLRELWDEEAARQGGYSKELDMSQLSLADPDAPPPLPADYGTRLQGAESALAHLLHKAKGGSQPEEDEVGGDVPAARESLGVPLSQPTPLSSPGSQGGGSQGGSQRRRSLDVEVAFTQQEEEQLRRVLAAATSEASDTAHQQQGGPPPPPDQAEEEGEEEDSGLKELRDLDTTQMGEEAGAYTRQFHSPPKAPPGSHRPAGAPPSPGPRVGSKRRSPSSSPSPLALAQSPYRGGEEMLLLREARRVRYSDASASLPTSASDDPLPSLPSPSPPFSPPPLHGPLILRFHRFAPSPRALSSTLYPTYRLLPSLPQRLHFSRRRDLADERRRHHHHHHPSELPPFNTAPSIDLARRRLAGQPHHAPLVPIECELCRALSAARPAALRGHKVLVPTRHPPTPRQARAWLQQRESVLHKTAAPLGREREDSSDEEVGLEEEGGGQARVGSNPQGVLGAGGSFLPSSNKDRHPMGPPPPPQGKSKAPRVHLLADPNTGKLVPMVPGTSTSTSTSTSNMGPPSSTARGAYAPKLTSQISPPTQTPLSGPIGSGDRGLRRLYPPVQRSLGRLLRHSEGNRHSLLCLEIHVQTRKDLRPDPRLDGVAALAYVCRDYRHWSSDHEQLTEHAGVILVADALKDYQPKQAAASGGAAAGGGGGAGGWCPVCKTKDRARFCVCPPAPSPLPSPPSCLDNGRQQQTPRPSLLRGVSLGPGVALEEVGSERALFTRLQSLVASLDPDFLLGWEVQQLSLGYLIERHAILFQNQNPPLSLVKLLSRLQPSAGGHSNSGIVHVGEEKEDAWGESQQSGITILGRTVLNLWRVMRSELKLSSYTLPNVVAHVLGRRFPSLTFAALTTHFAEGPVSRSLALEHVLLRAKLGVDLLDQLDYIGRTSEMARLFGIDFFSVLNRGSQYRVEATMMRFLKPLNYIAITASRKQVASQEALEVIPLVFEPQSGVYIDPVAVLDFQSLYPSMIISYNLCFSTCLGRIDPLRCRHEGLGVSHKHKLGVLPYPEEATSAALAEIAEAFGESEAVASFVSPSGAIFATRRVRPGVLPRMLHEILQTRFMVKKAMKRYKDRPVLQRVLNARQFALKMVANVTYGYASASFSGRMPMAELADAIVSTAKRTLTNAVSQVHDETAQWAPAEVVYGDTDSLFVCLRGRGREEALAMGAAISKAVTDVNPRHVVLKFDKVYDPCVLASKKRYVGRAFEEPGAKGHLDAKGIEVVRRDQCAIVVKMQEKVLRILFATRDLSQVKAYVIRQLTKMLEGRVQLQDFVFAKEVRMGSYAQDPPAAIVAKKAMATDPRAEPRLGERVAYVAVTGPPVTRLSDLVVDPHRLLGPTADPGLRINVKYYIEKQVLPALQRVLLCDVDVRRWYVDMPRPAGPIHAHPSHRGGRPGPTMAVGGTLAITSYYRSIQCHFCRQTILRTSTQNQKKAKHGQGVLCDDCLADRQRALAIAQSRQSTTQQRLRHLHRICQACCHASPMTVPGVGDGCVSLDCSVYYERCRAADRLQGDLEDLMHTVLADNPSKQPTDLPPVGVGEGTSAAREGGGARKKASMPGVL